MTPLVAWTLALLGLLAARERVEARATPALAGAIVAAAEDAPPLFADDADRHRTVALLVAVAWTEGRLDPHAVGDHGAARGAWQIHASEYAPEAASPAFLDDVELQARVALRMLRTSLKACRARDVDARLSWYASGSCDRGGAASAYRMRLARRLAREHHPP